MRNWWRNSFLTNRFFYGWGLIILLMVTGFVWPPALWVGLSSLILITALSLIDMWLLFGRQMPLSGSRKLPDTLSLGHEHQVIYELVYQGSIPLSGYLLEEWPAQLQWREAPVSLSLAPSSQPIVRHAFRPITRGAYAFGHLRYLANTPIGLVRRSVVVTEPQTVAVYPNIIAMKEWELLALQRLSMPGGVKKVRRLGHSYEFEQIKNYVEGDDYRSINWKATGRRGELMVNQYEDERSQQVYAIIDKSRSMQMPFEGMTLLDYAINTALVMANIALRKHDRAGMISFHDQVETVIKAEQKRLQLKRILERLYNEQPGTAEANYEALYQTIRKTVQGRSLLLLFTNFESHYALERVLPLLRNLNRRHLLLVIFFENTTLREVADTPVEKLPDIYTQTMAQHFLAEKQRMVQTLQQFGIQALLTPPKELSVQTVNKYLALKAKGLI